MNRKEFCEALQARLRALPPEDLQKTLEFYNEMIDERVENGSTEQEAVAALGSVEQIVRDVLSATPLPKIIKQKAAPKTALRWWHILLIVLGAPIWLPVGISAFAVVLSVYICIWAVVISCFAATVGIGAGAVCGILQGVYCFAQGKLPTGILFIAAALLCAGLCILAFLGSKQVARFAVFLGKKILLGIKLLFAGKGEEK